MNQKPHKYYQIVIHNYIPGMVITTDIVFCTVIPRISFHVSERLSTTDHFGQKIVGGELYGGAGVLDSSETTILIFMPKAIGLCKKNHGTTLINLAV